VFRGLSKCNLPGYVGFFQFLHNFRHQTACEPAELILWAALDPTIARRAKKGEFVRYFDHFDLLGTGSVCCRSICVLHLSHFLNQEDLMEREAMFQNP
jgi:hypothetical protein